eukprot:4576604-Alexandrium_andersonii.AAC.1
MSASLVGSEMCIRDRDWAAWRNGTWRGPESSGAGASPSWHHRCNTGAPVPSAPAGGWSVYTG